jgi:hypothetical protein
MFVVAVAFLAFLGGSIVVLARIFPYDHLNNAYQAGRALYAQQSQYHDPKATDLYSPARSQPSPSAAVGLSR